MSYGKGIHLCVDNCKANKEAEEGTSLRIVYPSEEQMACLEKDPVFIVIGGNTLSRGLTIEGLVCSYFARNSNQADTLMQMARWFGYRKGVELLQRIWMTSSVLQKFEALTKIEMDLKEEIERFMDRGISPSQFGPRIRNIPEIKSFRITSKRKSQQAEYDDFDFRGDSYETTDFDDDINLLKNITITEEFLSELSEAINPVESTTSKAYVWRGVDFPLIKNRFLDRFYISPNSLLKNNLPVFMQWIEKEQKDGRYRKWDIALVDGDNKDESWSIKELISVGKIERTKKKTKEHIDIGSLRSGIDAIADVDETILNDKEQEILKDVLKTRKDIIPKRSHLRLDDIPLILIYRIKKDGGKPSKQREIINSVYDIIGIGIIISGDGIGGNHAKSLRILIPNSEEEE